MYQLYFAVNDFLTRKKKVPLRQIRIIIHFIWLLYTYVNQPCLPAMFKKNTISMPHIVGQTAILHAKRYVSIVDAKDICFHSKTPRCSDPT